MARLINRKVGSIADGLPVPKCILSHWGSFSRSPYPWEIHQCMAMGECRGRQRNPAQRVSKAKFWFDLILRINDYGLRKIKCHFPKNQFRIL